MILMGKKQSSSYNMDELFSTKIGNLAKTPVELSGQWVNKASRRDWRGVAEAGLPFVAVLFVKEGRYLFWEKDEKRGESGDHSREIRLIFRSNNDGTMDCCYRIGQGVINLESREKSSSYLPNLKKRCTVLTGEPFRFVSIEVEPPIDLYSLFIVKGDINTLRKGLWHLKSNLLIGTSELWKMMLGYGRNGLLAEN